MEGILERERSDVRAVDVREDDGERSRSQMEDHCKGNVVARRYLLASPLAFLECYTSPRNESSNKSRTIDIERVFKRLRARWES